jgi:P27 family predicted phage terminase small subunit
MGRRPKSAELKLVEGNRGHQSLGKTAREPKPEKRAPACPKELQGKARSAWRYLVGELAKMNILATSDRGQMAAYCDAWGLWCDAKAQLNGQDTFVNGKLNPLAKIANDAMKDVVKYGSALGLNPVERTRVRVEPSQQGQRQRKLLGK